MKIRLYGLLAIVQLVLLTGCSTTLDDRTTTRSENSGYQNFLVLAISESYDNRAQYERAVASNLRKLGVSATPYHQAVGGQGQISREKALELIASQGFDGVLVTQVRNATTSLEVEQDTSGQKVTRLDKQPVDFFRYGYEELDEPGQISILSEATLITDLHRAGDYAVVWSYSWTSDGKDNIGILIDEASAAVARRLSRDRMLSRTKR